MSMTLDGFTFTHRHGKIVEGPIQQAFQVNSYPGTKGVSIFADRTKSRELSCEYTIDGASESQLYTALEAIDAEQGKLDGTLQITGTFSGSYSNVTFTGYARERNAEYSSGGIVGFVQHGRLTFIQRKV